MAAASPAMPASSTCKEPRVIILGCGLAGLNCARQLVDNGVDRSRIVVLEASKRIGGRIKTDKNFIKGFTVCIHSTFILLIYAVRWSSSTIIIPTCSVFNHGRLSVIVVYACHRVFMIICHHPAGVQQDGAQGAV